VYKIPHSFAEFRAETGLNGKASNRGSNIALIDVAFQLYEGSFPTADADLQASLTVGLYDACTNWLKLKQTKSTVTGTLIKTTNKNLLRRRVAISKIAKACVNSLRNGHAIDSRKQSFNIRKVDMLAKGTSALQATPLSGDYGTERKTWLGSGKTVSIAGHFHASQETMDKLALSQGNFNGMSPTEYSAFLQKKPQHVLYFKKETRLTTMLDFGDDGLTYRPGTQQLLDCRLPVFNDDPMKFIGGLWMYAMDSYGNVFSMPVPDFETLKDLTEALKQNKAKISNFNHSSFNAGKEVICAGLIGFTDGYIRWIDNNSGHYKPTRDSLKDAVQFMADEGRNLRQLMVGAYHYSPTGKITSIEVHTVDHFLGGINTRGDIRTL
jgi:hypothetical protein